ncbi:protein TolQ [Paracoccus sp. Z118]|uniref:protein TolQ n=1 Tax=Paracoccus sp. Z118 TaxID=2851017 RepID=UPI001C2B7B66|nr:protein TolQ [Paracoccus sp. Z118]MBV0891314.1 protein TolQ [Paracoccus sp. Z118]
MENLAAGTPVDFSLVALFMRASLTVQITMIVLVLASFWSWAVIIQKIITFTAARRDTAKFERAFWSGSPLDDVYDHMSGRAKSAAERVFGAGMLEWRRSQKDDGGIIPNAQQRIDRAMNVAIGRESDRLHRGLPLLATVGSTAPFVGLFGTVWGIKTAFEGIALSQNTSLAVVAPGIAEALLATALGLLAAIPAVIAYNKLSSDADRISGGYEAFADEFSTILSRQLEDD